MYLLSIHLPIHPYSKQLKIKILLILVTFSLIFFLLQGAFEDQGLIGIVGKGELGIGTVLEDQTQYYKP